jgi:hypothetical protein
MLNLFNERAFSEVANQLGKLHYRDELFREDYSFRDWFKNGAERRTLATAFAHTPRSYETSLIAVVSPNGVSGQELIDEYRALCAPVILEIGNNEINEWSVSRKKSEHLLVQSISFDAIERFFIDRTPYWKPDDLFRAKNLGEFSWTHQPSLFAGLLPELEDRIQESLEPILGRAMVDTTAAYAAEYRAPPSEKDLFKLIFSILTTKVFYDRKVSGFATLTQNSEEILGKYARKFHDDQVTQLLNREARDVAVSHIWDAMDFRNLSVEVLAQMWSTMLIDEETKTRLGIHRTSRTIVRYIVEKLELKHWGDDDRIIFEPCSGSSSFLIGAMNQLRHRLYGMTPQERHKYFTRRLVGMEKDSFGIEISKLALTQADFPNIDARWQIIQDDVFRDEALKGYLQRAGAVLCNPPFRDFDEQERADYNLSSFHKPVELLSRVLCDLHPSGILGFVLPRQIVDGRAYKIIREQLAKRFAKIDLTALPDRAFPDASTESALLVATEPFPHSKSRLTFSKVRDSDKAWKSFEFFHQVSFKDQKEVLAEEAHAGLGMAELPEIWEYLSNNAVLKTVTEIHRGLEWNVKLKDSGSLLVRDNSAEGYILGVAPQTKFNVFQIPVLKYLNRQKKYQRRNAYEYDWELPKVIFGKAPRRRGHWKIAAFPDSEGIACTSTYFGVWAKADLDIYELTAILNSPVANAFIASRESRREITKENLNEIPIPKFSESQKKQLRSLIEQYQEASKPFFERKSHDDAEYLLKQIDALVLDAYSLPPRLEHKLLKYFQDYNSERKTSHTFSDYLPEDCESYYSLSTHISPKFQKATVGGMLEYFGNIEE